MIFEVNDLIRKSNEPIENAMLRVVDKYPDYFEDNSGIQHIDIRDEDELESAIASDVGSIINQIATIRKNNGVKEFTVRHCYDPDGVGYYAICDKNGNNRRFIQSAYSLNTIGGCWSYYVWRSLLSSDVLLYWYLEQVKERIMQSEKITMEIRHLYLPYLIMDESWAKTTLEHRSKGIAQNTFAVIKEYKELHIKEYEEYSACSKSWYSGEKNNAFYVVKDILQKAVDDIYSRRDELEACGMWKKAYAVKDILIDMEYERGEFSRLRQFDTPREELLQFLTRGSNSVVDIQKVKEFSSKLVTRIKNSRGMLSRVFGNQYLKDTFSFRLLTGLICYVLENPQIKHKTAKSVSQLLDAFCSSYTSNTETKEEIDKLLTWCAAPENKSKNSVYYLTMGAFVIYEKYQNTFGFDSSNIIHQLKNAFDKKFHLEE